MKTRTLVIAAIGATLGVCACLACLGLVLMLAPSRSETTALEPVPTGTAVVAAPVLSAPTSVPPTPTRAPAATLSPTKIPPTSVPTTVPIKAGAQVYPVGEVVAVADHTIVLNSATIANAVLKANFTIQNKGTRDVNISSLLSFTAKDPEGVKQTISLLNCGSSLDGKVLPGDKLRGDICWKVTGRPVRIYYEASLFSSGAVVWEVK